MNIKIKSALYSLVTVFAAAIFSKYFVDSGLIPFYDILEKPASTPENRYFTYIWYAIWAFLIIGFYIALTTDKPIEKSYDVNVLFILELFLMVLWTFSFFYIQQLGTSVIVIVLLDIIAAMLLHTLFGVNKLSFLLFLPSFLWLIFATYLNIYIVFIN